MNDEFISTYIFKDIWYKNKMINCAIYIKAK